MKTYIALTVSVAACLAASASFAGEIAANTRPNSGPVDYINAKPMPLPQGVGSGESLRDALVAPPAKLGPTGSTKGYQGDGNLRPTKVPFRKASDGGGIAPAQFGTSNQPYTTSRADAQSHPTSRYYPFRAAGKLFFTSGGSTYVCSASLISRGLIVTAAHCVAQFGGGSSGWNSNWKFIPAYTNGTAPYGIWNTRRQLVRAAYINGTDSCYQSGVICQDDVAVLEIIAQNGAYPGTNTGWFGACWGGIGFTGSGVSDNNMAHITQLGYPTALDSGGVMERTDSYGFTSATMSFNTIIGSQQSGGASGGPWLVNFGVRPAITGSDGVLGSEANSNCVVGVAGWAYTGSGAPMRRMGASPFLSINIKALMDNACQYAASSSVCN